jgi:sugar transferase (PEP-CTERM/EpsH1 system associated)
VAPPRSSVLYVNHSMAMGGIEKLILDLVGGLPPDEFEPQVAVFEGGGSLEPALLRSGVSVHDLRKREGVDPGLAIRLRRLLRRERICIVHSHNYSAWLYSAIAARSLGRITHVHTEHSGVAAARRRYAAERWLSRVTTHVVAVSRHVEDILVQDVGIPRKRVRMIYNGVDTLRFAPDAVARDRVRAAFRLRPEDVLIGIVARLEKVKNHALLLRAFAPLRQEFDSAARLAIVGDGTERSTLERFAQEHGVSGGVDFLGERHDVPDLLRAFDIFVLTSVSEGMSVTLLEAMSCGLPVVATAVGGNLEIVADTVTGFLVGDGDVEALSRRLRLLVREPEVRARLGTAGRSRVLELFDQRGMLSDYMRLYRGEAGLRG